MARAFFALTLSFFMIACSSTGLGSPAAAGDDADARTETAAADPADPTGRDDSGARDDTSEVSCSYPPATNDPRCDTIDYAAPCDGSFSCEWPGRGDPEPDGCFATKGCFCTKRAGDDAGPDGSTVGRWTCVQ